MPWISAKAASSSFINPRRRPATPKSPSTWLLRASLPPRRSVRSVTRSLRSFDASTARRTSADPATTCFINPPSAPATFEIPWRAPPRSERPSIRRPRRRSRSVSSARRNRSKSRASSVSSPCATVATRCCTSLPNARSTLVTKSATSPARASASNATRAIRPSSVRNVARSCATGATRCCTEARRERAMQELISKCATNHTPGSADRGLAPLLVVLPSSPLRRVPVRCALLSEMKRSLVFISPTIFAFPPFPYTYSSAACSFFLLPPSSPLSLFTRHSALESNPSSVVMQPIQSAANRIPLSSGCTVNLDACMLVAGAFVRATVSARRFDPALGPDTPCCFPAVNGAFSSNG